MEDYDVWITIECDLSLLVTFHTPILYYELQYLRVCITSKGGDSYRKSSKFAHLLVHVYVQYIAVSPKESLQFVWASRLSHFNSGQVAGERLELGARQRVCVHFEPHAHHREPVRVPKCLRRAPILALYSSERWNIM